MQSTKDNSGSGDRVEKTHGGNTVELIKKPEAINNPDCEHDFQIDPTETDFVAYVCVKDKCGLVIL